MTRGGKHSPTRTSRLGRSFRSDSSAALSTLARRPVSRSSWNPRTCRRSGKFESRPEIPFLTQTCGVQGVRSARWPPTCPTARFLPSSLSGGRTVPITVRRRGPPTSSIARLCRSRPNLPRCPWTSCWHALASTRPLPVALEHELRRRERLDKTSAYMELDPLRRFDDSGLLLQRVRQTSLALWRLQGRLGRPTTSLDALHWRLHRRVRADRDRRWARSRGVRRSRASWRGALPARRIGPDNRCR